MRGGENRRRTDKSRIVLEAGESLTEVGARVDGKSIVPRCLRKTQHALPGNIVNAARRLHRGKNGGHELETRMQSGMRWVGW